MGVQQSMQSLAYIIPPLFSGLLLSFGIEWPIITAFGLIFISWLIYVRYVKLPTA